MKELTSIQIESHLRRANEIGKRAMQFGKHPFGCILVAPGHETVLIEQGNIDQVDHAEAVLARLAHRNFSAEYLWDCTLFTNVEPCCMCAGTVYWANIGQVVFGISEAELLKITGNHVENPTLSVPCRYVFEHGQKDVKVIGPLESLREEIEALHRGFWK